LHFNCCKEIARNREEQKAKKKKQFEAEKISGQFLFDLFLNFKK